MDFLDNTVTRVDDDQLIEDIKDAIDTATFLSASIHVEYQRKGETEVTAVQHENPSYRGVDDEYVLTVQIRARRYEPDFSGIQSFVEDAIDGSREVAKAEKARQLAEKQAQIERLQQEMDSLLEQ